MARTVLNNLTLGADDVFKPVHVALGGERVKVALARLLLGDSDMLILDEPTNHLDIYALEALEKVLSDYAGTLLLVSHDRRFLNGAAKRLLIIENGALTEFEGTPDEYDKKRAVRDEDAERQRRERELGVDALRMRMAAIDARLNGKGISGDERERTGRGVLRDCKAAQGDAEVKRKYRTPAIHMRTAGAQLVLLLLSRVRTCSSTHWRRPTPPAPHRAKARPRSSACPRRCAAISRRIRPRRTAANTPSARPA